jgi:hypothetical protein
VKNATFVRWLATAIALLGLSHPVIVLACDLGAYASPDAVGVSINAASGLVESVTPGSAAAAGGLQKGDLVDFSRTGPLMHLWLWDSWYPVQKAVALPVIRGGQPLATIVVARASAPDAGKIAYDLLSLLWAAVLMGLACAGVFARADVLTLAFFGFCYFYATLDNTAWLRISPPLLTPWTALEASLSVWLGNIGFLYLCFRFPTGQPLERWRVADRAIVPIASLWMLIYYLHFYQSAFSTGGTSSLYSIGGTLVVLGVLLGLAAYVARFWGASGPEVTRMRWVAAAIAVYAAAQLIFFIDQIVNRDATPWVTYLYNFNPAPFAFAYSLVRGRILDIRIVGGRAVIYALVTSIPVALLAFADWFFARRLEDARLATVFEIGIAIAFSFWLRSLHKRIDRFAERIFFASRHRAFQRMHHIVQALPFTEKIATIESLLTEETASAMGFSSAALFRADDGHYVRTAETGWRDETQTLDADDPIVLFARSAHRGVALSEAPQSKALLPSSALKPVFALPIVVGRRVIAVVLYGGHLDGEAIDAEEEQLLTGLAHAAATAYEHLHAIERERENALLRVRLQELGVT